MSVSFRLWVLLALIIGTLSGLAAIQPLPPLWACGGFFCQNSPVDQNAERIIFAHNQDGTISTYIQIQYTGSAPDFSWILPLPSPIGPEAVEVPDDAMAAFTELEVATDPVFIPPPLPQCAIERRNIPPAPAMAGAASAVEIFASGEVGPYGFDVIGSDDPEALISWLREHDYRVTADMEPLIDRYVEERFVFLAMRLLPDQGDQDVQPVKVTYPSARPMIPLRLTAVAANPNMAVMVWFYADSRAVPVNYAEMEIADSDLTFFSFGGGSNYRQLMSEGADELGGQAFITEYAGPACGLAVVHPLLQELRSKYAYVTRLNTVISPEEMTVNPIIDYDPQRPDVSNIHDLSKATGLFDCERDAGIPIQITSANEPVAEPLPEPTAENTANVSADLSTTEAAPEAIAAVAGTGQPTQSAPRESTAPVSITPGAATGTGTESVAESKTQAEAEAESEPRAGQGTEGQSSAPAQDQYSRTATYAIIGAVVLAAVGLTARGIIMRCRAGG